MKKNFLFKSSVYFLCWNILWSEHALYSSVISHVVIDPSLTTITNKVIPLCHSYVRIGIFVDTYSRYECGMVNHALCAAIRSSLQVSHRVYVTTISLVRYKYYFQTQFYFVRISVKYILSNNRIIMFLSLSLKRSSEMGNWTFRYLLLVIFKVHHPRQVNRVF